MASTNVNGGVEILISSIQHSLDPRAFQTVRVSVSPRIWHITDFQDITKRVAWDKVPAMLTKLEAEYNVSPTSHHREQYELLAAKRQAL